MQISTDEVVYFTYNTYFAMTFSFNVRSVVHLLSLKSEMSRIMKHFAVTKKVRVIPKYSYHGMGLTICVRWVALGFMT